MSRGSSIYHVDVPGHTITQSTAVFLFSVKVTGNTRIILNWREFSNDLVRIRNGSYKMLWNLYKGTDMLTNKQYFSWFHPFSFTLMSVLYFAVAVSFVDSICERVSYCFHEKWLICCICIQWILTSLLCCLRSLNMNFHIWTTNCTSSFGSGWSTFHPRRLC